MPYFKRKKKKPVAVDGYEPNAPQELQDKAVADLALSENTKNALDKAKVITLGDILRRTERDMFKVQGFGRKNLDDVKRVLDSFQLNFKPDDRKPKEQAERQENKQNNKPQNNNRPQNQQNNQIAKQTVAEQPKPRSNVPGEPEEWEKFSQGNKWGFKNLMGKVVIEPVYDEIFRFKEGYACFEKQGEFGYINTAGEIVIEPQYECAMSFSEGLASVTKNDKCGYIDKDGKVIINYQFDTATAFEEGTARVKLNGSWNIIDKDGKLKVIG